MRPAHRFPRRYARHLSLLFSGLVIVTATGIAVAVRRPQSGVAVRVVAARCEADGGACADEPLRARIRVRKRGRREILATHRPGASGRFRFSLDPGRYVLLPDPRAGAAVSARPAVPVRVPPGEYANATLRYRLPSR
jgi:hypothetical protein